jgi:hypothetical protein
VADAREGGDEDLLDLGGRVEDWEIARHFSRGGEAVVVVEVEEKRRWRRRFGDCLFRKEENERAWYSWPRG